MPRVQVSYGPPGHRGVTSIMGLGADDVDPHPAAEMLRKATWVGLGLWAIGVVMNRPTVRGLGLGAAAVGLGVRHLAEKSFAAPAAPATTPAAGW